MWLFSQAEGLDDRDKARQITSAQNKLGMLSPDVKLKKDTQRINEKTFCKNFWLPNECL